jgi:protein-tyrosine-phosphatase
MAEGLFRKAVEERDDYAVSSAGVAASKGTRCSTETADFLKKREITMSEFSSRQVSDAILSEATHVFAMTRGHLEVLEARFPKHADKFYLVREFAGVPKNVYEIDVPDPIGMGRKAYEEVGAVLDTAIPTIIAYIDETTQ